MITTKKIKIKLTTKEPFRIGGPEDPIRGQDNPVAIVGEEIVVPGPSLKGAYRSELESYLIDTYYDKTSKTWKDNFFNYIPCIPAPRLSNDEKLLVRSNKYKEPGCQYPGRGRNFSDSDVRFGICPVCYLLGANGLNGFIRVPFLRPVSGAITDELYSARIDRYASTVTRETNRPYSVVPMETQFEGMLEIVIQDDIRGWVLGKPRPLRERTAGDLWLKGNNLDAGKLIKEFVVDRIPKITIMGGYKSKGCGKVKIEVTEQD